MQIPNLCSLYPVFVESLVTNEITGELLILSTSTGCVYKYGNDVYLITNWHILSGRNTNTKQPIHGTCATPTEIRVHYPRDGQVTEQLTCIYSLCDAANAFHWLEHPLSSAVDVAAIKIFPPAGIETAYVSDAMSAPGLSARKNFFSVAQEVWAIGFPRGIRVSGLPIWKRTTIASEPGFSVLENPHKILLDTATREGMSGSSVVFVSRSTVPVTFDGTG